MSERGLWQASHPVTRSVPLFGSALLLLGCGVFLWKAWLLDMPILPSQADNVWRVELEVDVRSTGRRGSVELRLPSSGPNQNIFDEQLNHGGLGFELREAQGQRVERVDPAVNQRQGPILSRRSILNQYTLLPGDDPVAGLRHFDAVLRAAGLVADERQAGRADSVTENDDDGDQQRWEPGFESGLQGRWSAPISTMRKRGASDLRTR